MPLIDIHSLNEKQSFGFDKKTNNNNNVLQKQLQKRLKLCGKSVFVETK